MNIYEKIQSIRVELESMDIKMSGRNEFAKYDYFELDDFIKPLNELMQKYKMTAFPSFTAELATLTAVNSEKPDEIVTVTSPMGKADLKGCHEVQNIGAVETYQRRYLYQALFDITEKDGLNKTQGKPDQKVDGAKPNILATITTFIETELKKGKSKEGIINAFILGTSYESKKQELTNYTLDKYGIESLDQLSNEQLRDALYQINVKAGKIK